MIEKLHKDLLAFASDLEGWIAKDLGVDLLEEIVSDSDFPYETGRLKGSGFAFAEGGLVGRSSRAAPSAHPPANPPIPPHRKGLVSIVFTAPKLATAGARYFYTEGGERLFDYAPHVHEGGFGEHTYIAQRYVESYMNMIVWKPIIDNSIGRKWSRKT